MSLRPPRGASLRIVDVRGITACTCARQWQSIRMCKAMACAWQWFMEMGHAQGNRAIQRAQKAFSRIPMNKD